jgi:hypothetical protein
MAGKKKAQGVQVPTSAADDVVGFLALVAQQLTSEPAAFPERAKKAMILSAAAECMPSDDPDPWLASLARIVGGLSVFAHSFSENESNIERLEQAVYAALLEAGVSKNHDFIERMKRGSRLGSARAVVLERVVKQVIDDPDMGPSSIFRFFRYELPRMQTWSIPTDDKIRAIVSKHASSNFSSEAVRTWISACAKDLGFPGARNLFSYLDKAVKRSKV